MQQLKPNWINRVIRWIKRIFSAGSKRGLLKILENYYSEDGAVSVLRLQDSSIPGCTEIWRVDRHHEKIQFFIAIINLKQLRAELTSLGTSQTALLQTRAGSRLADDIQDQLKAQKNILATHYWITGFREEFSAVDPHGRHYRSSRLARVRILACDLQGAADSFSGDRYARKYARKIITRVANDEFRERAHHRTWQAAVKTIDWASWLEGLSRSHNGGISSDHVLQPQRSTHPRKRHHWQ